MPIRSNLAAPECPQKLPIPGLQPPASGTPGELNWNKLIDSQKYLQQAGIGGIHVNSTRQNGIVRPLIGFSGNSFFENNGPPPAGETTAEIQQMTIPFEILPGLNMVMLTVYMKLAALSGMNSQLIIKIARGAAVQTLMAFRATTGTGFITGIVTTGANNPYINSFPIDISTIIPQAGTTEIGAIIFELRKFNPRGNVNNAGAAYYDGLLQCQVKQYKDCP